jgi:glycosyltransferase involved in cell wall biosynthesis
MKHLRILGTRGVPAAHGGFETFAERLALHLVSRGWKVTVYCQETGTGPVIEDRWQGVDRIRIPVASDGAAASVIFDWHATRHASVRRGLCLTLGYNTALFCALLRRARLPNLINMDGIEWHRAKWGKAAKAWFRLNEWAGCRLGDHLIADHPEIAAHLTGYTPAKRITTIAYGAETLSGCDPTPLANLGLEPGRYCSVIARPEPENSVLEVVQAFSRRPRGISLAVLGNYREDHAYHRRVRAAAGPEVKFLGAIYDKAIVDTLREHSFAYVHGHQVGGTNPSLVEALGAGNAVLAHDNRFNRWVANDAAAYFDGEDAFARCLDELQAQPGQLAVMRQAARRRHAEAFTWPLVLSQYEGLLETWLPAD